MHPARQNQLVEKLTYREMEILALLGERLSNDEIASRLHISINSVKWYLSQIFGKLGVSNRRQAVASYQQLQRSPEEQAQGDHRQAKQPEVDPALLNNLPFPINAIIGRNSELSFLLNEMAGRRAGLLTLAGPGGIGKTRLAIEAAHKALPLFPDGAWFIDLAPLDQAEQVAQTVSAVLGLKLSTGNEEHSGRYEQQIAGFLRAKKVLLVLDNCEHLLDACARLADGLLKVCATLTILATSREPLGITGEVVLPVPPLSVEALPRPHAREDLERFSAVQLFSERAQAFVKNFALTEENLPIVVRICQSLDGIPLAIELAAARANMLSLQQIAGRLDDRFLLLTGGSRTALPRHQTLRASIDWSYELLTGSEQKLFQRLSVFKSGCSLEAVEAIWTSSGRNQYEEFDLLTSLVNKSLVQAHHHPEKAPRYRMLETIRQYALEKLEESGDWPLVHDLHLAYYLDFAERIEPELRTARRLVGLHLLKDEIDNFHAALGWALQSASPEQAVQGLRLAAALVDLWKREGLFREGLAWVQKGLDRVDWSAPGLAALHARAFSAAGVLAKGLSHFLQACQYFDQSIDLYRALNDQTALAETLILCADAYRWTNTPFQNEEDSSELPPGPIDLDDRVQALAAEALALTPQIHSKWVQAFVLEWVSFKESGEADTRYDRLKANIERSIALYYETGDRWSATQGMRTLGIHAMLHGDPLLSQRYFSKALELCREEENKWETMHVLSILGDAAYFLNDFQQVENCFREALEISRQIGYTAGECWSIQHRGVAARRLGNLERAAEFYQEGLDLFANEHPSYCAEIILGIAGIACDQKKPVQALTIMSAVEALFGTYNGPVIYIPQAELEKDLAEIQRQLDEETRKMAWDEGRLLTMEQAIALAARCIQTNG